MKLYEKRKCAESRVPPLETTQLGLSRSLGIRVTHVANELKDLERDGYVQFRKTWVADAHGKRKAYNLTPAGYELARSLAESRGIDLSAKPVNPKPPDDDWLPELKNVENGDRPRTPAPSRVHPQGHTQ
jgi:DNA-binding MarR family transcriptional regulator